MSHYRFSLPQTIVVSISPAEVLCPVAGEEQPAKNEAQRMRITRIYGMHR